MHHVAHRLGGCFAGRAAAAVALPVVALGCVVGVAQAQPTSPFFYEDGRLNEPLTQAAGYLPGEMAAVSDWQEA